MNRDWGRPEACLDFDIQPKAYANGEPYVPSARSKGSNSLANVNPFQKFPRNVVFYLTTKKKKNPSSVQLDLRRDCLFWTLSLPET